MFEKSSILINNKKVKGLSSDLATQLKILTPKQMLQRLSIALAQVKAGNTSENLPNEIRQIINSLYRIKEITKKLYNTIMNSIKLQNRMDTIFMNSKNSGTSDPHRLLLSLLGKIDLERVINMLLYQTLVFTIHGEI